jgi:hypothetical protein
MAFQNHKNAKYRDPSGGAKGNRISDEILSPQLKRFLSFQESQPRGEKNDICNVMSSRFFILFLG